MKQLPKKIILCFLFLALVSASVFGQEHILLSYKQNFIRAGLAAKAGILRDAATDSRSEEFIGELYEFALQFALENGEVLTDDADMIALISVAARGAGMVNYRASAETLWKIFLLYRDSLSRVEILRALAALGNDEGVIDSLNQFLVGQNNLFRSGEIPDYPTLSACIAALGSLGDSSSFPVLFSAFTAGYPSSVNAEIQRALESLRGNYAQSLNDIIRKSPPAEKLAAFRLGMESRKLILAEQGALAQTALDVSINYVPENVDTGTMINSLRYAAISSLTGFQWTQASPLVIRHFYRIQTDFQRGEAPKERLLEALACLGAMGNAECAQVLALQLGYSNSRAERSGDFDEDIILTLIQALGDTGDKAAFDYLLYIRYLNYPEKIQAAARDALTKLQW